MLPGKVARPAAKRPSVALLDPLRSGTRMTPGRRQRQREEGVGMAGLTIAVRPETPR
jgi:hypothetical protein